MTYGGRPRDDESLKHSLQLLAQSATQILLSLDLVSGTVDYSCFRISSIAAHRLANAAPNRWVHSLRAAFGLGHGRIGLAIHVVFG